MPNHVTSPEIPLDKRSIYLRQLLLRALVGGGRGHVGAGLSLVEIIRVLYDDILQYRAHEPGWPDRDRCILSKGHGCLALYSVLADKGFFSLETLESFCKSDSILGGHPESTIPGVDASTGSLGHGFAIGVGMAIACRLAQRKNRVFVILGDGECNEGSIWESAMHASKHQLDNLTVIIDCNKLQSYGPTDLVLNLEPFTDKWRSFGFNVAEVNGHDIEALKVTLANNTDNNKPHAIIAHTVKGKGVPAAENNPSWHHKAKLLPEELEKIQLALGVNT